MPFLSGHENEFCWIEAAGKCACIHTIKGSRIVHQTLEELEKELDPAVFARVHESAIVRRDQVRRLRMMLGGNGIVEMKGGAEIPVSHQYFRGL